jgi:alanine racemase
MPAVVEITLDRVRRNAVAIADRTGVPLLAVVKADAYGLGAARVADALTDLGNRLAGFYVFDAAEAVEADLHRRTGRRTVALHGDWSDPDDYRAAHIQPVVWSVERARSLRAAHPVLSLDTGQQRFACPPTEADAVCQAGDCHEAMTHATRPEHAEQLRQFADRWHPRPFLHAAGSALLDAPSAWFDAVRPGMALYAGAVRLSAPLIEVRDAVGPAGYTGFCVQRFGVIGVGYRNGLKPGPCRVGGRTSRVLEVGMQSAFVEVTPADRAGDPVVLLGHDHPDGQSGDPTDSLTELDVARAWNVSPQEVLVRVTAAGSRQYR